MALHVFTPVESTKSITKLRGNVFVDLGQEEEEEIAAVLAQVINL